MLGGEAAWGASAALRGGLGCFGVLRLRFGCFGCRGRRGRVLRAWFGVLRPCVGVLRSAANAKSMAPALNKGGQGQQNTPSVGSPNGITYAAPALLPNERAQMSFWSKPSQIAGLLCWAAARVRLAQPAPRH